jgi:hypothetical protein
MNSHLPCGKFCVTMRAMDFDYSIDFKQIDFRKRPDLYRIGRGEQGVLSVEPYKSEILPHWRFKTPEVARESAAKIYEMFLQYKTEDDFVGMDMARKFLQMGWPRSLRYFNHRSGKKYTGAVPRDRKGQSGAHGRTEAPFDPDYEKLESAKIFKAVYDRARHDEDYLKMKERHRALYGQTGKENSRNPKNKKTRAATKKPAPVSS